MTKTRQRPAKFVLSRVVVAAAAVVAFVGLWAAIAATDGAAGAAVPPIPDTIAYEVVSVRTTPGDDPVVIVERQPIHYVYRYVDQQGNPVPAPALPPAAVPGAPAVTPGAQDQPRPEATPAARKSRAS